MIENYNLILSHCQGRRTLSRTLTSRSQILKSLYPGLCELALST